MEVVCVIGERLYHTLGSECHKAMSQSNRGLILTLTDAQAHEVGMEPCGYCVSSNEDVK